MSNRISFFLGGGLCQIGFRFFMWGCIFHRDRFCIYSGNIRGCVTRNPYKFIIINIVLMYITAGLEKACFRHAAKRTWKLFGSYTSINVGIK